MPQPPTERGFCAEERRPTAWGGARSDLAAQTTAPTTRSVQRQVLCGWSTGSPPDVALAGRAPLDEKETLRRCEAAAADRARCRCVGGEERRPTAWGGAPHEFAAQKSRQAHAARSDKCSVGGRLVIHRTKRARAARYGTRKRRLRQFKAAAADRARCRWRGASANGVGWSAYFPSWRQPPAP